MEHNWVIDRDYGDKPQNLYFCICSKCNIEGWESKTDGYVYIILYEYVDLSCEECIIKNIIE